MNGSTDIQPRNKNQVGAVLSAFILCSMIADRVWAFNCSKASTPTEQKICNDPDLKRLDAQMGRDYVLFMEHYKTSGNYDCLVADEKQRQIAWLKKRDACGADRECIAATYKERIDQIGSYARKCAIPDSARPGCKEGTTQTPISAPVTSTISANNDNDSQHCAPAYRYDMKFVAKHEGGLAINGYVPGAYLTRPVPGDDEAKIAYVVKNPKPLSGSGVTIDTGFDLAQQTPGALKATLNAYIREHGNLERVDVDSLVQRLSPYMNKSIHGEKAFQLIKGNEPTLEKREVKLIQEANASKRYVPLAEGNFDSHNQAGLTYKQLPAEVQSVLLDFVWNYGGTDEIYAKSNKAAPEARTTRKNFWNMVYGGDWENLTTALERADRKLFPRQAKFDKAYTERFKERGRLLRKALQSGWPKTDSSC
ncbi:pesticin C-terminus-like muramidase [Candidatus Igneacidithiobacillus taiwanensis]|uniref:pesticin C-terminus-like muramidase n=1 Tax=Candidatus Igneacidithiobacillus taiwanensis TaxID=1945924 RepID=UPI0028993390|nr:pesticin C-terminus-like muramidase [Candidatus Igneacidithiobacillus taiwanensis]